MKKSKKIYFIYTLLFIFISIIVFSVFILDKRSFIWQSDGLKQHYIILKNFNEILRNFFSNPQNGIQLFSWNMGLGLDIIGQYSYYVLGDPFAYISLLFPLDKLEIAYSIMVLLRMFCVGIAFITYARHHENKNIGILLGAIIYTFSSFALYAGVRHPYFLNAMILFPLLLCGVDKLLESNQKVFLTFWVAVSAISNYYFFYMHIIMLAIYAIIQYFCKYSKLEENGNNFSYQKENIIFNRKINFKKFFRKLGSGIICIVIGVLIAGAILLPTIYAFLNSARSSEETICKYGLEYYGNLFTINLLSAYGKNWSYIGVSSIILIMLPIIFSRWKKNKAFLIYFIITTIFLLVPFMGSLMNGFSFPNNRWCFIYTFILAYIVTLSFNQECAKKELKYASIFLIIYSALALIVTFKKVSKSCFTIFLIQIIIAFCLLAILTYKFLVKKYCNKIIGNKGTAFSMYLFTIISICVMSFGLYSSYDKNYANEFVKMGEVEESLGTQLGKNENYEQSIKHILNEDKSFYRIAKIPHQIANLSMYYNYPSTECFLSIGNNYVYELNRELADYNYSATSSIRGVGNRSKITTLLGTKYYIADEKNEKSIPYGYYLKENINGVKIFENKYPLSLGIVYTKYILREDYEKLSPLEKEDAITKYAVIDKENLNKINNVTEVNKNSNNAVEDTQNNSENIVNLKDSISSVPYYITDNEKILKTNEIKTNKKEQKILFTVPKVKNSELYVFITGFEFQGTAKHIVTAKFKGKTVSKEIDDKIYSAYYQKSPELLLPLGYYEEVEGDIELKFSAKGTYKFDKIQVVAVPMNNYDETMKVLQQNELKEVICNEKEIKGKINLDEDGVLQISTSYTKGWKAYVDGKETETIIVNTAFIGIPVNSGEHEIYLKYETPYLKEGIIATFIGIGLFVVLVIVEFKKNKK